jgi:signal transduction histidine kinase
MNLFHRLHRLVAGSLTRKLVVSVLLVHCFLIGVVTWEVIVREGEVLEEQRLTRAEGFSKLMATSGGPWMVAEDLAGLSQLTETASTARSVRYAMFISPSGRVLAHSREGMQGRFLRDSTLGTGEPSFRVIARTPQSIDVAAPVVVNDRLVGWAWVSASLSDIRQQQRELLLSALTLGAVAVILGLLIAFATGRGITRRLEALAYATDRFRIGERTVRVTERGCDEVAAAARGVNAMFEAVAGGEQSLRDAQRIAQLGSWSYDPDTRKFECSPLVSDMFGGGQALAPTMRQLLRRLQKDQRRSLLTTFQDSNERRVSSFTLNIARPDGSQLICWVEARAHIASQTGKRTFVGVCQDVTERESSAAQLRQSQKMEAVGQLTGGLAHDFNNLLAIIIGNLDLLAEEFPEGDARESVEEALSAAVRGAELTRQLLAFSRRQPLASQTIDLNQLISGISSLWRRTVGVGVDIKIELEEGLWPTLADPSQVESAVLNLVINARDAMPDGGTLTVETRNRTFGLADYRSGGEEDIEPGDYSVVTVSDTGSGMSPETIARAFEPFFTTKAPGKGTGLGLSMIYGFARQSGGQVRIYSEPGHGTSVSLYLPRAKDSSQPRSGELSQTLPAAAGETVLLVEDDEGVRRIAKRQLCELGYRVVTATNGPEALASLAEHPEVELLFTDIVMPGGMNGVELSCEALKAYPGLKVLHTSGFTKPSIEKKLARPDSIQLLRKPYRKAELAEKVRRVLDSPSMKVEQ